MSSTAKQDSVLDEIGQERLDQKEKYGFTAEHDDKHADGSMAMAAACYAAPSPIFGYRISMKGHHFADPWPWMTGFHRGGPFNTGTPSGGKTRREQLIMAAALLVAEIERMDRDDL